MPTLMLSRSRIRMTTDWPWSVGSMLTRRSMSLPCDGHLDAAVLRAALLGDVDLTHDLEAGEQRREQPARGGVALDQHAVDPVADPDAVGERLDVDVRRPAG